LRLSLQTVHTANRIVNTINSHWYASEQNEQTESIENAPGFVELCFDHQFGSGQIERRGPV